MAKTNGSNTKPVFTSGTAGGGLWCGGHSGPSQPLLVTVSADADLLIINAPIPPTNPMIDVIIQVNFFPSREIMFFMVSGFLYKCQPQLLTVFLVI
jgi:hypothetical protein